MLISIASLNNSIYKKNKTMKPLLSTKLLRIHKVPQKFYLKLWTSQKYFKYFKMVWIYGYIFNITAIIQENIRCIIFEELQCELELL